MIAVNYLKTFLLNIAKTVLIALLIIFIIFLFRSKSAADISVKDIKYTMTKAVGISQLEAGTDRELLKNYGLAASDIKGYVYYLSSSNMNVDELLVVKMKNRSQAKSIEKSVETYIKNQRKSFEGYGPQQVDLLSKYILLSQGDYIFAAVSKNAEKWKEKFEELIR